MKRPGSAVLRRGHPDRARHPGALAGVRQRRAAPVPEGHETRDGFQLAAEQTGPARPRRPLVVADFKARSPAAAAKVQRDPEGPTAWPASRAPIVSDDGKAALIKVVPREDPESASTLALMDRLRAEGGRTRASRGGQDRGRRRVRADAATSTTCRRQLWKIFLFVLICSYLVLLVVLRSVVLPLKAVLMNLLTVGAAYGVLVMFFQ